MGKEVILNLDFLDQLCGRPSPEEEFAMEKCIIDIKETQDIELSLIHISEPTRPY